MREYQLKRLNDENTLVSRIQKKIGGTDRRILLLLLLCFIFSSVYLWVGPKPTITGDGGEYLGMTCSIFNHLSPDLRPEDIILRNETVHEK